MYLTRLSVSETTTAGEDIKEKQMAIKQSIEKFGINQAANYVIKDPDKNLIKLMTWVDRFSKGEFRSQREAIRAAIENEDNPYHPFVSKIVNSDPDQVKVLFNNFFMNANLVSWDKQQEVRDKYDCNVPWTILLDPTSACNLHCTGCWAAEYGNKLNLSFDEIDDIVRQGKDLGVYMYIFTGGEPLVRKDDVIRICEKHSDCVFLCFTNGTLIDEKFADEVKRVHNFIPAISLEGDEAATDGRRGRGTYQKVMRAMNLLHERNLMYGLSSCYTSQNFDSISSEEYFDQIIDMGAMFIWLFHYMPVGKDAHVELLPSPEQRTAMFERIRDYRSRKPIFVMDFQNDGEYVGGCIAGGRRYFHINASGDMDPCVFIHYSDSNIREKTLLEGLRSPLFMQYHDNQPFNDNMLRPCPMLENPEYLRKMVVASGAKSTDPEAPETAEELCSKCDEYAEKWAPVSEKLWYGSKGEARFEKKKEWLDEEKEERLKRRAEEAKDEKNDSEEESA